MNDIMNNINNIMNDKRPFPITWVKLVQNSFAKNVRLQRVPFTTSWNLWM